MVSSLSWAQGSDRLHLDTTTSTHPPSLTGASGAGARSCGGSSVAPHCSPCRRRCRLNARLLLTVRTPQGPPTPPHPPQRSRAMQRAQPGRLRCKACPTRALNRHTAVAEERAQETPRAFPTLRTPAECSSRASHVSDMTLDLGVQTVIREDEALADVKRVSSWEDGH